MWPSGPNGLATMATSIVCAYFDECFMHCKSLRIEHVRELTGGVNKPVCDRRPANVVVWDSSRNLQ